jgi:hypothetical protein
VVSLERPNIKLRTRWGRRIEDESEPYGGASVEDTLSLGAVACDRRPWQQHALLGRGWWGADADADALRHIVRDDIVANLGRPDADLLIDV